MKQTAVEWLQKKLIESGISFLSEEIEYINQAKEMEKEQMLEVSKAGCFSTFEFEQYYKETYGDE